MNVEKNEVTSTVAGEMLSLDFSQYTLKTGDRLYIVARKCNGTTEDIGACVVKAGKDGETVFTNDDYVTLMFGGANTLRISVKQLFSGFYVTDINTLAYPATGCLWRNIKTNKLYVVRYAGTHTETSEALVVYRGVADNAPADPNDVWCRPLWMWQHKFKPMD
jgi:hypothetical protein